MRSIVAGFSALVFSVTSLAATWGGAGALNAATGGQRVIAVVGDSMARGYCQGLKRQLDNVPGYAVECWAKPSSGLTRDDFFDWSTELNNRLRSGHIDFAVVSMGANDAQGMTLPNKILKFSDPEWADVYGQRVSEMIRQFKDQGTNIFWIGMPMARSPKYTAKMQRLNEIYAKKAMEDGASFISLWELTQDGSGGYARTLADADGRQRVARQEDGIHFNRDGEEIVSCYILHQIGPAAGLSGDALNC